MSPTQAAEPFSPPRRSWREWRALRAGCEWGGTYHDLSPTYRAPIKVDKPRSGRGMTLETGAPITEKDIDGEKSTYAIQLQMARRFSEGSVLSAGSEGVESRPCRERRA